ncbi:polysaccharide biosynthesis protein [Flavobacterium noncentrifugens]|uniref:Membrane protein involved in the export of O-antigen and teichoic acid n=1 Tax=Flavobacterium noncentrifugens TaxID=1128970 RepID=A0A1G8YIQ0_9FLAO|nr:oligosaccharide flippase family protein [Flavobacterium noncentrifugens]GEP51239.1 polysaccharide biosynthesis protein [Flavobacterium noncentrifugens]SDK02626.1 Membrane protein involved in the export of O-antigen and teichoic acid [Flavobacterium noncentrifugens]
MGIVQSQSIKNTIITFFGFGIGAVNALFLYTNFLGKLHYGVVAYVLSAANILMPLMAFGVHNTLIRFYAHCKDEKEREEFLTFMLVMPLAFIIPLLGIIFFFEQPISDFLAKENPMLRSFLWLIPVVGFCMGYFEIFYAWVKVHMQSVFGNFISEVVVRVTIMVLLFAVYFGWISKTAFVYAVAVAYLLQLVAMQIYAVYVKMPVFRFVVPHNVKSIFGYSMFIILSGSVAVMLLDFDKVMIPAYRNISDNALYSVAIFIATVIAVPSRAMTQIIYPITAKLMAQGKHDELNDLYKKSAINLQVIGGLVMLYIFLNIKEMYHLIPKDYSGGIAVVFMIGLSKFYDVILGNNNAIIFNSRYYRSVLLFGLLLVFLMIVLNMVFIPLYGIEGAALATLLSVLVYNTIKLLFVVRNMDLYPFTNKTVQSFGIISVCFVVFYFWDFPFHPIVNIALKSGLITVFYVVANYRLAVSEELNVIVRTMLKRVKMP